MYSAERVKCDFLAERLNCAPDPSKHMRSPPCVFGVPVNPFPAKDDIGITRAYSYRGIMYRVRGWRCGWYYSRLGEHDRNVILGGGGRRDGGGVFLQLFRKVSRGAERNGDGHILLVCVHNAPVRTFYVRINYAINMFSWRKPGTVDGSTATAKNL